MIKTLAGEVKEYKATFIKARLTFEDDVEMED
jgi:hypothetical protein